MPQPEITAFNQNQPSPYGYGNPSPNLLDRYAEVYNRPGVDGDANRAALLWDSKGQSSDWAGQNAYGNFLQQVGRAPTLQELMQFIPIYRGSYDQGNAAIANYAQMEAQKPQNLQKNAGQYANQVSGVFQNILGRAPTQDEISHFGGLFASGNVDAYQLQDFLRGTTEFQSAADSKFRSGLSQELENQDVKFFDRAKQGVMSQFMRNGTMGSTALDSALTDLMGQIAERRASYMSNLSAQQYGGNKELALNNYNNTQNQYLADRNYGRDVSRNAYQGNVNRSQEIGDYYQQMRDYQQGQQGRNTLHTGDWINLGMMGANTAAQAYMRQPQNGGNFNYLNGGGYV